MSAFDPGSFDPGGFDVPQAAPAAPGLGNTIPLASADDIIASSTAVAS